MGYEGKDDAVSSPPKKFDAGVKCDKSAVEELVSKDINATRNEYLFETPAFITKWLLTAIVDVRDLPITFLFFNITCMTIPAAALIFYLNDWRIGLLYFVTNLLTFQERFILGLHYSSHRPLFKPQYALLNQWAPLVLCPFLASLQACITCTTVLCITKRTTCSLGMYQRLSRTSVTIRFTSSATGSVSWLQSGLNFPTTLPNEAGIRCAPRECLLWWDTSSA